MALEFTLAGIQVEREYTIGTEWATRFLPETHYLKKCIEKLMREVNLDEDMQGYLLVTIGNCVEMGDAQHEKRIDSFEQAILWIKNNTIEGNGIAVTNLTKKIYPEVAGFWAMCRRMAG